MGTVDYPRANVSDTNVQITDSYKVSKKHFDTYLNILRSEYDVTVFRERTNRSMTDEWACHNFVYDIDIFGWFRDRTKDVDMQYPLAWWEKIVYPCLGWFCKIFIK